MSQPSAGLGSRSTSPTPNPLMFTRRDLRPFPDVTAFSSPTLVETAQHQIDLEINKYAESIRGLRTRRNALSPIGRLPPEILSRVFIFCTDSEDLSWIKEVSHISRHWRAVALGCPQLWSFPVFYQPKWADEMLKRSKSAALTIKADLTRMTPRMVNALHSALPLVSRIENLDLKTGSRSIPEILNLTETAPYLHSLSLASPGFSHEEHFTLPDTFLNGEAPRLRRLELSRFCLPWNSPLMANLIHLKVQNPGAVRPSIAELVDALERMPLLETLELDNALPNLSPDISALSLPNSRVELSRLKRIVVTNASVLECANVLNRLSYPSTASMKILCVADNSTVSDFSALIPTLSNVHSPSNAKHLRSLHVNIGYGGLTIRAWTSVGPSGFSQVFRIGEPPLSRAFLDLDLKWRTFKREDSEDLLALACRSLPLRSLYGLSISSDMYEIRTKTWISSTLANLPALHTVRLRGLSSALIATLREDVLLDGVKQIPDKPAAKPAGRRGTLRKAHTELSGGLFFPALRHLILEDTDFVEPMFDTFLTTLMERCERRQELWTLSLYDCLHVSYRGIALLKEIVGSEVVWDEIVQGFSESESEVDMLDYDDDYGEFYSDFFGVHSDDSMYDYPMF